MSKICIVGSGANKAALIAAITSLNRNDIEICEREPEPTVHEFRISAYPQETSPYAYLKKEKTWQQPRHKNNYKARRKGNH
jgi:hypothetical protein